MVFSQDGEGRGIMNVGVFDIIFQKLLAVQLNSNKFWTSLDVFGNRIAEKWVDPAM